MVKLLLLLISLNISSKNNALNKNVLENNIESKRKLMITAGMSSMITNILTHSDSKSPKNGFLIGLGFELFRDKLSWDFFYTYYPTFTYKEGVRTSINDFGFNLKGMQSFSRYYSVFGTVGIFSRQELKDYTAYSFGVGVDFNITSFYSVSVGFNFNSSFKSYEIDETAASRSSNFFLRNSLYL